ncbi:hypothetical protein lerEdw1_018582 [Lerista edwardsae]|nr:hypothetical protein lerEdw1_018582 [Lerista edwardsae]
MSCSNFSSADLDAEEWILPPCSKYLCPLLPIAALIPVTVVSLILLVLGVAGNVLTILLTARVRELRNTVSLYLGSLAVADLLLLLLGLPIDLYRLWRSRPWVLGVVMCRVWHWSGEACAYCSILHLTALTVERYLAICSPLRAKVLITRRRVKGLLAVIWTVALLSASPFFFLVSVQQQANVSSEDDFSHECVPTLHAEQSGMLSIMLWVTTSYFLLPVFCLYILYGLIVRELLRGSAANLGVASHRGHRQTVRMLGK